MKKVNVGNVSHVSSRKKGQAHIEVIISFVVFITAIIFLLAYIQPQKSLILENSLVENVKQSFVNAVQTNLDVALINKSGTACKPAIFDGNATKMDLKPGYYYVYVSAHINNTLSTCLPADVFVIGNIQQNQVLSIVLLDNLKEKYYNNYDSLKNELNIPGNIDFAVVSSGYELTRTIPEEMSVDARIYRMKVLYSNGTIKNEDFTFKIW